MGRKEQEEEEAAAAAARDTRQAGMEDEDGEQTQEGHVRWADEQHAWARPRAWPKQTPVVGGKFCCQYPRMTVSH